MSTTNVHPRGSVPSGILHAVEEESGDIRPWDRPSEVGRASLNDLVLPGSGLVVERVGTDEGKRNVSFAANPSVGALIVREAGAAVEHLEHELDQPGRAARAHGRDHQATQGLGLREYFGNAAVGYASLWTRIPKRVPSDSEEKPPRMAAKTNEGGSEEAGRRLASGEKGKNRAVRRKSDRLLGGMIHPPRPPALLKTPLDKPRVMSYITKKYMEVIP